MPAIFSRYKQLWVPRYRNNKNDREGTGGGGGERKKIKKMGRAERYGTQLWNAIFGKKAEWRFDDIPSDTTIVSIVGDINTRRY